MLVDVALDGHVNFFKEKAALLSPENRVLGKHPLPDTDFHESLGIDGYLDFFYQCPIAHAYDSGPDTHASDRVLCAYDSVNLPGFPSKDYARDLYGAKTGAEIASRVGLATAGHTLV